MLLADDVPGAGDTFSVRAYAAIRAGVPETALRLSEGRNVWPPPAPILRAARRAFGALLRSPRLRDYESPDDLAERRLLARLLSGYLGWPELDEQHVLPVAGAQEGISLVYGWAAQTGLAGVVPLPAYYSFEQSARRWGVRIAAYAAADGRLHGIPDGRLLEARIIPNAVTGGLFAAPALPRPAAFTLVDVILQAGELHQPGLLARALRQTLGSLDPERVALVMTASKDLSVPRLRAGLLLTRHPGLRAYARADRLERVSAPNPLPGQVMAYYLGLLAVRAQTLGLDVAVDVAGAFQEARLPWLGAGAVDQVLVHWAAMAARNAAHLRLLRRQADLPLDVRFEPEAGYSVFADLVPPFADAAAYLRWCREAGVRHGLRLNPSYVLGGTPSAWEGLYPGRALLRLNLSYDTRTLRAALTRLVQARRAASAQGG